jgi:sn-glycerol 3-phosphate transport system substrate-binding protein
VLGERVDEIVSRYNASQSKYTVVATNKGNYDEVINGTIAAYRAKKAPHLVQIYERGFMTMLLSEAIVPVQDLMTEKKKQIDWADFIKPVASYYQYKGKLMTMPFNSSAPILWYNKGIEKAASAPGRPGRNSTSSRTIKSKGISECGLARRRLLLEPDRELQRRERPAGRHQGQRL